MNEMEDGGMSSQEKQRQTAAEIARKKVLEAYNISSTNQTTGSRPSAVTSSTSTSGSDSEKWKQYHTAWQNYYQKYYGEYYAKAAQKIIDSERQKYFPGGAASSSGIITQPAVPEDPETVSSKLKANIQKKANSKFQVKSKYRRLIPIAAGVFVMLFILFLQYNRMIFAPIMAYIAPGSGDVRSEITAIDPTVSQAVAGDTNKIMIPKLNIDVPVAFGISNDLDTINDAMNHGVAQFRVPGASAYPGEIGNTVISGHSAGDIYSSNPYKFIFSGLERLTEGDLIYIDYNKVRYTYKMTGSRKVEPDDVASLKYEGDKPVLTLITCWPVGTSRYRLLIDAEQINPATGEVASTEETPGEEEATEPAEMPENEKTFFENFWSWLTGGE